MKTRLVLLGGLAALLVASLWWTFGSAQQLPEPEAPLASAHRPPPSFRTDPTAPGKLPAIAAPVGDDAPDPGHSLVEQLASLFATDKTPTEELELTERAVLALGERATPAVVTRLDRLGPDGRALDPPNVRERLFHLLRRLPGAAAEARISREALQGAEPSLRTMAIESLGQRKSDGAFETLAQVARLDPQLPARPLLGERRPGDRGTEVPDEATFTPRMQAMAALAEGKDPRAAAVLGDIAIAGPDESLRMEAARSLGLLRDQPQSISALQRAATSDPSATVRLSALHAMIGASDQSLAPVLEGIVARDRDAGVRRLAEQVLASLGK
jgi:hypothetical protein